MLGKKLVKAWKFLLSFLLKNQVSSLRALSLNPETPDLLSFPLPRALCCWVGEIFGFVSVSFPSKIPLASMSASSGFCLLENSGS
ncbi:hypothetical protein SLA2020_191850 [Shorea laevis]